jgi:hypothetical protein
MKKVKHLDHNLRSYILIIFIKTSIKIFREIFSYTDGNNLFKCEEINYNTRVKSKAIDTIFLGLVPFFFKSPIKSSRGV